MDDLTIVSLFSGAGGFDWGFHRAGFKTCLANELLKAAANTLAANLGANLICTPVSPQITKQPQVIQGNIAEVCFDNVDGFSPAVLIGGPPCQDYSVVQAQRRKGMRGKRGKLYSYLIEALVIFQPKVFVFENVEGLVNANKGQDYQIIVDGFSNPNIKQNAQRSARLKRISNYVILFNGVVEAAKFGVPQARRRLIIISLRQDLAEKFGSDNLQRLKDWVCAQMNGSGTLMAAFPLTCIEALEGKPLPGLADKYREVMQAYAGLWRDNRLPSARVWHNQEWKALTLRVLEDYLTVNQIDPKGTGRQLDEAMEEHEILLRNLGWLDKPLQGLEIIDKTNALPKGTRAVYERMLRIPPGENHEFVKNTPWEVEGKGINFIYRRAFPLKPAPTVMAYGGGGTYGYHYARERTQLTLREKARIQTFMDTFLFTGNATEIRAQVGEAVPPLLAEKIAHVVQEILSEVSS